jgi:ribosomal protein S24E
MDFWSELHEATEAVKTGGKSTEESLELAHLPDHIKQHLMTADNSGSSFNQSGSSQFDRDPAFRNLPDHLKNNPYAHLSRKELTELYEKMLKDPAAHQAPFQNIDQELQSKMEKDGKPYIDPEGGCTIQPNPGFVVKSKDQNEQKVFVNMTFHEMVDPPEEKHIPDSDQPAVRIPLSLGDIREDFDKKGDPWRVLDVIWNPEAIKKGTSDMLYRHGLVELAFEYIKQKHNISLDLKYKVPKHLKYKGKTVQFQRVRARKGPKIEQLNAKIFSDEEQKKIQETNYDKVKNEEMVVKQKKPNWKLYWIGHELKGCILSEEWWWKQLLIDKLELIVDPDKDEEDDAYEKVDNFLDETTMKRPIIEEYDGLNDNFNYFVVVANLNMLMRGHSIRILTQERKVSIDVPNLYYLTINFPILFDKKNAKAYFDWKRRTLAVILPIEVFEEEIVNQLVVEKPKDERKEDTVTTDIKEELTSDQMLFDLV